MNHIHPDHDQFFPDDASDINEELDFEEEYESCPKCGGDGYVDLSECPELWGEDCFCEPDRQVLCPECLGKGV